MARGGDAAFAFDAQPVVVAEDRFGDFGADFFRVGHDLGFDFLFLLGDFVLEIVELDEQTDHFFWRGRGLHDHK